MASRFQVTALASAPAYPTAVDWSDENLIAVASRHFVTILNPALPLGPRGLVTLSSAEPFPIGVIDRANLFSASLVPISLARDTQPRVRSVSWSPIGLSLNSGCLLAVCTTEGSVKLYRQPFCDFSAEWTEVVDISTKLYDYLESISFGEMEIRSSISTIEKQTKEISTEVPSKFVSKRERKRRNFDIYDTTETDIDQLKEIAPKKRVSALKSKSKPGISISKSTPEKSELSLISPGKYVTRSSMLSSLVVAWSPLLQLSPRVCSIPPNGSSASLLAIGSKSGQVSVWRVSVPESYSIEPNHVPTSSLLVWLGEAHNSWITAVSWAMLEPESSNPLVLLVTGASDGSVKIWLAYSEQLLNSTEANNASFSLLKEVVAIDLVPVSVISVTVPTQSSNKMLLAIGKGAGSFEVWDCDVSNSEFNKFGSYDAHDNIVTGLAWAFDGNCLYSCGQDNFVRSWILCEGVLSEAPIPSNTPCLKGSTDISNEYVSCLGAAVSPGNLVIAVVRNFDEDLLDPMYQKRAHKASVELFWIGGQEVFGATKDSSPFLVPGFPDQEMLSWENNILWSLKQYECQTKPLVLWDITAALLAFKRYAAEYVEHVLLKWLLTSFSPSSLFGGSHSDISSKTGFLHISALFSETSSRRLHLLNILCRRVVLSNLKADQINSELQNSEELNSSDEKLTTWMELLLRSERELRERLFCLSSASSTDSSNPDGFAQMERWVKLSREHVKDRIQVLASESRNENKSLQSSTPEQCCFCSAPVPFESPEVGICQGVNGGHRVARCSVSMKICPANPTWLCACCHRRAFKLAPESLFTLTKFPSASELNSISESSKPLCPFCGILLQRLQPDFLLSVSQV